MIKWLKEKIFSMDMLATIVAAITFYGVLPHWWQYLGLGVLIGVLLDD